MSSPLFLASVLFIAASIHETNAFSIHQHHPLGSQQQQQQQQPFALLRTTFAASPHVVPSSRLSSTRLWMASPDLNSDDPFVVLGIDPSPDLDKKAIKRAYKRLAIKYHPDVSTTKDSTPEEKRKASDRFAKINWAYQTLSAGTAPGGGAGASSSRTSSSSTASSGWTPPHRRSGSYTSSSSTRSTTGGASTDWRDYVPNYGAYEETQYDADGDSFGAIFSDLFSGAAGAVAGNGASGARIFKDFVDFLEDNVDGYGSSSSSSSGDDAELQFILQAGSIGEVGEEMDDTELVVQQLSSKRKSVEDELVMLQAELAVSKRFSEKLQLEERIEELQARKKVVENYTTKARKRLLALQSRYKQLIVQGNNDPRAGGRQRSYDPDPPRQNDEPSTRRSSTSSARQTDAAEDSWKEEGFGSFGRGRGSSRRRASRRRETEESTQTGTSSSSYSSRSADSEPTARREPASRSSYDSPRQTQSSSEPYVPPHRRTSSSFDSRAEEDKKRMRELQVEDEFEKLKRELGM